MASPHRVSDIDRTCPVCGARDAVTSCRLCGYSFLSKEFATETAADRFWAKVDKSGECWVWSACKDKKGYGRFGPGGRKTGTIMAHRFSWALEHGEIPQLCVLHKCDNPSCVRPDHLFLGTKKDNAQDAVTKGRWKPGRFPGETNKDAKLTDALVLELRTKYRKGDRHFISAFAHKHCVSNATVRHALFGRTWRHLPLISNFLLAVAPLLPEGGGTLPRPSNGLGAFYSDDIAIGDVPCVPLELR